MAWSQIEWAGSLWDCFSLKTFSWRRYRLGILGWSASSPGACSVTRPMKYRSSLIGQGQLTFRGRNSAFFASGLRKMIGNWVWSIQPRFQSIFGCIAANHG